MDNKAAPWGFFEEVISGDYVSDAGNVLQSTRLTVLANSKATKYSNHVIAQRRLNSTGADGTFTYRLRTMIVADSRNNLTFPQTGPEISVQNTRQVGSNWVTNTMAVQYVANPWTPPHWRAWKEISPGLAKWVFLSDAPVLQPNRWYTLELKADMQTKVYSSFKIFDVPIISDLTPLIGNQPIADELKWAEAALWVTCEAENLFQDNHTTSEPTHARVDYDDVDLTIVPP